MDIKGTAALRLENVVERAVTRALEPTLERLGRDLTATRAELARVQAELDRTRAQLVELTERVDGLPARFDDGMERVHGRIEMHELRSRRDVFAANERAAAASSGRYAAEHFRAATPLPNPEESLRHALAHAPSDGMALEFGVYQGTTLRIIAEARGDEQVFGFDSFEGLPEDWRIGFPAGAFGLDGLPDVPGASLVRGWFEESLPGFMAEHPGPVDFVHMDGDLYSSAVTVLAHVGPRLGVGSVIQFDEYYNHEGWERGEHLAWLEFVEREGITFEYLGYTFDNEQVSVRITGRPSDPDVGAGGVPDSDAASAAEAPQAPEA